MRKAILSLVVALGIAGVASALPATAGGTLYIGTAQSSTQTLQYIDLGTDWLPTASTPGACVTLATVFDFGVQSTATYGSGYGFNNSGSLSADMGGTYHNADLLLVAETGGDGSAHDLVKVSPAGTSSDMGDSVANARWGIVVDSGFTPLGEARGIATLTPASSATGWAVPSRVITESVAGSNNFDVVTTAGSFNAQGNSSYWNHPSYSAISGGSYTVNGLTVTGVLAMTETTAGGTIRMTYKVAGASTYVSLTGTGGAMPVSTGGGNYGDDLVCVGDTDGNGVPDFYYDSGTVIAHGQDLNGDGDFDDIVNTVLESQASGISYGSDWTKQAMELVKGTDGAWALITQDLGGSINLYPLNASGQYVGGMITILASSDDFTLAAPGGTYAHQGLTFVPLGSGGGQGVPEPGTMLLVGTGVLGLAGVLRRRFLD